MTFYQDAENRSVQTTDKTVHVYREVGPPAAAPPLVLLQHFRGNLDNWDPALVDALAVDRRVLTLDYAGVGGSSGRTADRIEDMARDCLDVLSELGLDRVDLLGFSIGSFVAQQIALTRPDVVRRLVLASAAPEGAMGMHGWSPAVLAAIGTPDTTAEGYLDVFFAPSSTSRAAGTQALGRMAARTVDRDKPTDWATRTAQYDAVVRWGIPSHAVLERLTSIEQPTFVANGDTDPMILPRYSYLLAGLIPDAVLKLYPDSAHGFLFQHHQEFATDVLAFFES